MASRCFFVRWNRSASMFAALSTISSLRSSRKLLPSWFSREYALVCAKTASMVSLASLSSRRIPRCAYAHARIALRRSRRRHNGSTRPRLGQSACRIARTTRLRSRRHCRRDAYRRHLDARRTRRQSPHIARRCSRYALNSCCALPSRSIHSVNGSPPMIAIRSAIVTTLPKIEWPIFFVPLRDSNPHVCR